MKVIKFGSDTKHRKQWFTGISFSHPAKMSLPLQLWIIDNFTQEGETILDPMAGMGTILVACSVGRNVITNELEDKFVRMELDNWAKIKQRGPQLGYKMGWATILQGDARNLEGLLVDKCIFSAPYPASGFGKSNKYSGNVVNLNQQVVSHNRPSAIGKGQKARQIKYGEQTNDNIANLPYGEIDKIITSPPYTNRMDGGDTSIGGIKPYSGEPNGWFTTRPQENIGNLRYGSIDAVISSPPYEGSEVGATRGDINGQLEQRLRRLRKLPPEKLGRESRRILERPVNPHTNLRLEPYSNKADNIGNLKSDSYLSAMLLVYQNCFAVLKDGGLLILVTKNFIRNKTQIRLDLDTIKLCEQAGFTFQDRWYRELANQSFWRTIYYQKFPDVEPIKYEDILVFRK